MKLLIATPVKHGLGCEYVAGLLPVLQGALKPHTVEFLSMGGPSINVVRNELAYMAVSGGYDALLQIDEDLQWGVRHVERIIGLEVDIASALYCKRKPGTPEWLFIPKPGALPGGGLLECSGLPTGFLFTTTRALKAIAADNPHLAFDYKEDETQKLDATRHEWFPMGVVTDREGKRRWLAEDYGFSRLASKAGFSLWQDLGGEIIRHGPSPGFPITMDAVGYRKGEPFLMPPALDL